jgi:hypothetical protein
MDRIIKSVEKVTGRGSGLRKNSQVLNKASALYRKKYEKL